MTSSPTDKSPITGSGSEPACHYRKKTMMLENEIDESPLRVTYTLYPEDGIQFTWQRDRCVGITLSWIDLTFGRDEYSRPVVFAIAGDETFLLSADLPPKLVMAKLMSAISWVFAVDISSKSYLVRSSQPVVIDHAGFLIEHGTDSDGADYLLLTMPNEQMHLLFRDPATPSTLGKGDSAHIGVTEGMEIGDFDGAIALVRIQAEDAQRAAVIDALMDRLISPFPPCDASPCVTDE